MLSSLAYFIAPLLMTIQLRNARTLAYTLAWHARPFSILLHLPHPIIISPHDTTVLLAMGGRGH